MTMSTLRWADLVDQLGPKVVAAIVEENRRDWSSAGRLSVIRLRCHDALMRAYAKSAGGGT